MSEVVMLVLPFPAQGHLNQLLHFCRLVLSSSNNTIPIHFLGSAIHNRQAKSRLHGWNTSEYPNLQFYDLHVPPYPTPPPDSSSVENFPAHLQPAFDATQIHLQTQLANLVRSFSASSRRVVVVHDSLMSFAAFEGASVESYTFHSVSAFANLLFQWESRGTISGDRVRKLGLSSVSAASKAVTSSEGCFTEEFLAFIRRQHKLTSVDNGRIINTCLPLEAKFIELFAGEPILNRKPLFHIGPLHPLIAPTTKKKPDNRSEVPPHESFRWLDKQPQSSVLYVSFGTTTTMSSRQINELSAGLERSQQSFLWVIREADRGDIFAGGGGGASSSVVLRGRGIVVRDWVPQLNILAHAAVGGFMTHCGWNSCIESLSYGVPMVVWPMHSDQPRNSVMVTEILRVGVPVREWSALPEVVESGRIESAIRGVMKSTDLRRRAQAIGASVRQAASKDGSSAKELNSFINLITRP